MFASPRNTKLLAATALLTVIGLGPQQHDRAGETLKAATTTPPALIRPAVTRDDVQAWILGAVPRGAPRTPGRQAEADQEP